MEIVIIAVLIVFNGLFAMSEMSVVSARKTRLQQWADEGNTGAGAALALANEPGHFLSTIQIGITVIGIFSGAFGEATVAMRLADWLADLPVVGPYSKQVALAIVVAAITYFSLILGELVPKRLALQNPELIATFAARPMGLLTQTTYPVVRLLSFSTEAVLRLLGAREREGPPVTEEEIKTLMEQGAEAGVFEKTEQALVSRVFRLDEMRIGSIMTPRLDIVFLDLDQPAEENWQTILDNSPSRYPVCRGDIHNVVGIVHTKDLLPDLHAGKAVDLAVHVRGPLYVPVSVSVMVLLETFKRTKHQIALVVDEYGEIEGLVTLNDVLEAIVGDMPSEELETDAQAVQREDGSWLFDGMVSVERFKNVFAIEQELPGEDSGNFHTLGGFFMTQLGRVPKVADHFEWHELRLEVMDMDRNRIDKVLVARLPTPAPEGGVMEDS
jgi:putative hemolysin